jgi:exodeoxyribonuclease VII small subunit
LTLTALPRHDAPGEHDSTGIAAMSKSTRKLKFETAMERLDQIVEAMESGELGIEESIAKFEEAIELRDHCRQILDQVEQRVQKILDAGDGKPKAAPLQPAPDEPPPEEDNEA